MTAVLQCRHQGDAPSDVWTVGLDCLESHRTKTSHVIPRDYAMGMSAYLVHTDERLYPESTRFMPERGLLKDGGKR
ncbi:cytochrome p450 [Colletotrichum incanum]|uniref:Cytochrome p450 n=1 Tax=Colletotrichum incanum TaxID=1573173 RepID=A0A167B0B5_COLIC|nr:cytochrome p450 [Colletotrichum incanum]